MPEDYGTTASDPAGDVEGHPQYVEWQRRARQAKQYLASIAPRFSDRDRNAEYSYRLRNGTVSPPVSKTLRGRIPTGVFTTKPYYSQPVRDVVNLLLPEHPKWTFYPDSLSSDAGIAAEDLSVWCGSMWRMIEEMAGNPLARHAVDGQVAYGAGIYKVHWREDRWANLPYREDGEGPTEHRRRVKRFKSEHLPFDVSVRTTSNVYYTDTTDGLAKVVEKDKIDAFQAAEWSRGLIVSDNELIIPIELDAYTDEGEEIYRTTDTDEVVTKRNPKFARHPVKRERRIYTQTIPLTASDHRLEYLEYWVKGEGVLYMLDDKPIHFERMDVDDRIPYFIAKGVTTSGDNPGQIAQPLFYDIFELILLLVAYQMREFAYVDLITLPKFVKTLGPDSQRGGRGDKTKRPNRAKEEDRVGAIIYLKPGEKLELMQINERSKLLSRVILALQAEIARPGVGQLLSGDMPASGTTGYLVAQLLDAHASKFKLLKDNFERTMRTMTLYILDGIDKRMESEVYVPIQKPESQRSAFAVYRPGQAKGNRNLSVTIKSAMPNNDIATAQWLMSAYLNGLISMETVQRLGFKIDNPALENDKIRLERFTRYTEMLQMVEAMERLGQRDALAKAARMGQLPEALQPFAQEFASGPERLTPAATGGIDNPNAVQQPQPGLGQSLVPTTGGSQNARPGAGAGVVSGGGRAAGEQRQPANQPGELRVGG